MAFTAVDKMSFLILSHQMFVELEHLFEINVLYKMSISDQSHVLRVSSQCCKVNYLYYLLKSGLFSQAILLEN